MSAMHILKVADGSVAGLESLLSETGLKADAALKLDGSVSRPPSARSAVVLRAEPWRENQH